MMNLDRADDDEKFRAAITLKFDNLREALPYNDPIVTNLYMCRYVMAYALEHKSQTVKGTRV